MPARNRGRSGRSLRRRTQKRTRETGNARKCPDMGDAGGSLGTPGPDLLNSAARSRRRRPPRRILLTNIVDTFELPERKPTVSKPRSNDGDKLTNDHVGQ